MGNLGNLIFEQMTEIDKERQAKCIHCDEVWYVIHYRDGVCHTCQQKGLPGRQQIADEKRNTRRFICGIVVIALAVIWCIIFG